MTDILPKWRAIRAEQLHEALKYAPGNTPPLPPRVRKPTRNMKLELADAEITRCKFCGSWATNYTCTHCAEHGCPVIDDFEERKK